MSVTISEKTVLFSAPNDEKASGWGVYCLPRLWRLPDRRLIIRINGEIDDTASFAACCPDVYFVSSDEGEHWSLFENGASVDRGVLGNVGSPYVFLKNGDVLCLRGKDDRIGIPPEKVIRRYPVVGNDSAFLAVVRQGDLSPDEFGCERILYRDGKEILREDAVLDLPERHLELIDGAAEERGDLFARRDLYYTPYITSICELPDGDLVGLCCGQEPTADHHCGVVSCVASTDGGRRWTERALITANAARYPFGLIAESECSLAVSADGTLYCVTRNDMSCDHTVFGGKSDLMLFCSRDGGRSWSDERALADSSVTPRVHCFGKNTVAVTYGRPGVHMIVSYDKGKTFTEHHTIIGKTLEEELAAGKTYLDAKYFDTSSYANSFTERLSEDTFLIVYNDLHEKDADGRDHKATLLRKITVSGEE